MRECFEKIREHIERSIFISLPILLTFVCFLPIMSGTVTDGEAATFVVRGYNLISFSPLSVVTLIAPIILLLILFCDVEYKTKEVLMIALIVLSSVGFVAGFNAARDWLYDTCNSIIEYRPEGFIYPFILPILAINIWLTKNMEEKNEDKCCD